MIAGGYVVLALMEKYGKETHYIPYGADILDFQVLNRTELFKTTGFMLEGEAYSLIISRLEPENNVEMIIKAFIASQQAEPLLVVGSTATGFGRYLLNKFGKNEKIIFTGAIFKESLLATLRANSKAYFHGHSIGGTNPSLLEAMASSCLVFAHDNIYNRKVLGNNASYFSNEEELARQIRSSDTLPRQKMAEANLLNVKEVYNWDRVTTSYIELFSSYSSKAVFISSM